nr:uncharacterized protein LOC110384182 [Helicoverpa armigera]
MDKAFVKFITLWMMYIAVTMSMPSKETNEHLYSRLKRTPGDFSLFGINLGSSLSKAKESFSSIGNIFSPNQGNRHQYDQSLPPYQYDQSPYRIVQNPNIRQPVYAANENGLTSSINQDRYQTINNNNNGQFQTRNQLNGPVTDRYQTAQNVPETKDEITQSKPEIDKQLLNYIFQSKPNSEGTTTVDPTYDFTTETGEYDNTTMDGLEIRIPPAPVVASLLG